ncbi:hypothetical protein KKG52_02980 [Patescibacteria group bacterium]|nr:hypothetical protein [Patescibacteria group bacterium]
MKDEEFKNILNLSTHRIKNLLASAKALIAIFRKSKNQKQTLSKIEGKINLINFGIDNLFESIYLTESTMEFFYEFFDFKEILIKQREKSRQIVVEADSFETMGDREKLEKAIGIFINYMKLHSRLEDKIQIKFIKKENKGKLIIKSVNNKNFNLKLDNDLTIELYIARKIIELHGGKYKEQKNKVIRLSIDIPKKAKRLNLG